MYAQNKVKNRQDASFTIQYAYLNFNDDSIEILKHHIVQGQAIRNKSIGTGGDTFFKNPTLDPDTLQTTQAYRNVENNVLDNIYEIQWMKVGITTCKSNLNFEKR